MNAHPDLPGLLAPALLADEQEARPWPVAETERPYESPYITLDLDTIVGTDGSEHQRAILRPHDAIGVLAIDAEDRVLLVQQYRHSTGRRILEIPAGILDVDGEEPLAAAQRELAEEADLQAETWTQILELVVTPGYSTEQWTIFRATGLAPIPKKRRTSREAEEADMQQWWMPFDEAVAAIRGGRISDTQTAVALLAEAAGR